MPELNPLSSRGRRLRRLLRPFLRQIAADPTRLERIDIDDLTQAGILTVGRNVYGRPRVLVWSSGDSKTIAGARVRIGNYVSIATDVEIAEFIANHPSDNDVR